MPKITKRPFILKMKKQGKYSVKRVTEMYEVFVKTLTEELISGNEVVLTGFGTFTVKFHKGHKTGFEVKTSSEDYVVVKFTPADSLRDRLNKKTD